MATVIHLPGTGRNGSTMLHLMLANGPDAFGCGEVHSLYRPYHPHHLNPEFPCDIWNTLSKAPAHKFHVTAAKETGAEWIVDSSKDNCWIVDGQHWAKNNNMRVVNIFIWKDPLGLAYSYWKRKEDPMTWFKAFANHQRRLMELDFPFVSLRIEDLQADPSATLERLCKAIGMNYFEGKERFWEVKSCHLFGSGGIREQVVRGKSMFVGNPSYPAEFEKLVPEIKNKIENDERIQYVLKRFKETDISTHPLDGSGHPPFKTRMVYPAWYYAKRAINTYRGYKPYKFDEEIQRKAETIPTSTEG